MCLTDVGSAGRLAKDGLLEATRQAGDASVEANARLVAQAARLHRAARTERLLAAADRRQAALDAMRAQVDDLTGALRREAGFAAIGREIDRCRRGDGLLVMGILDIDGLKWTNDTRGHLVGDQVIRDVVVTLRSSLRTYDVIVRFGGDEFVFSIAGCGLAAAPTRIAEVQGRLSALNPLASISAGFAGLRNDDTVETLLARADADLLSRRAHPARAQRIGSPSPPTALAGRLRQWPDDLGLTAKVTKEKGRTTIFLEGDLDAASAPSLAMVLARALGDGSTEIVLDLTDLELIDSNAVDLIVRSLPIIRGHGGRLVVRSARPLVRRILDLSGAAEAVAEDATITSIAPSATAQLLSG